MQKVIISVLVLIVLVLFGIIFLVNREPKDKTQVFSPDSMMTSGQPNGPMTNDMPCHKMGNGQWMGQCEFDENGNPKQ